jgi:hypothetical protein
MVVRTKYIFSLAHGATKYPLVTFRVPKNVTIIYMAKAGEETYGSYLSNSLSNAMSRRNVLKLITKYAGRSEMAATGLVGLQTLTKYTPRSMCPDLHLEYYGSNGGPGRPLGLRNIGEGLSGKQYTVPSNTSTTVKELASFISHVNPGYNNVIFIYSCRGHCHMSGPSVTNFVRSLNEARHAIVPSISTRSPRIRRQIVRNPAIVPTTAARSANNIRKRRRQNILTTRRRLQ